MMLKIQINSIQDVTFLQNILINMFNKPDAFLIGKEVTIADINNKNNSQKSINMYDDDNFAPMPTIVDAPIDIANEEEKIEPIKNIINGMFGATKEKDKKEEDKNEEEKNEKDKNELSLDDIKNKLKIFLNLDLEKNKSVIKQMLEEYNIRNLSELQQKDFLQINQKIEELIEKSKEDKNVE